MENAADRIANEFIAHYETAWDQGAEAVARLYASDSVLVGYATAIGRSEILRLLREIIQQGWTRIKIKTVNVRQVDGIILVAIEYTAFGSGAIAGKTLNATSSHVLVHVNGEWLSTLHTAR
jgi:uncharacterized protein (TIGR02246 family)